MKFFLTVSLTAIAFCFTPLANASISINTQFAQLFQSDGITGIGAGRIGILVADEGITSGLADPFNTVLNVGNYLGGTSDDRIIGVVQTVSNVAATGGSGMQQNFTGISYSGAFDVGDKLYVLWFPTISTVGATVGSGVSYGMYRSDNINTASGSTIAFFAPSDGSSVTLAAYLDSIAPGSGVTPTDFTASLTTVPEPSTYGLLGIAVLGGILWHRRIRRSARPQS